MFCINTSTVSLISCFSLSLCFHSWKWWYIFTDCMQYTDFDHLAGKKGGTETSENAPSSNQNPCIFVKLNLGIIWTLGKTRIITNCPEECYVTFYLYQEKSVSMLNFLQHYEVKPILTVNINSSVGNIYIYKLIYVRGQQHLYKQELCNSRVTIVAVNEFWRSLLEIMFSSHTW